MWNNYWGGRPRRNVPQVNYNQSSDDDDYDSPLVSPTRPPVTRAGSPAELAVPTLNDNVDDDLAAVSQTLRNVGRSHTFRGTRPSTGDRPEPEGGNNNFNSVSPEVSGVVEETGLVVGEPAPSDNCIMPDPVVKFDEATGNDGADVYNKLSTLKTPFTPEDPKFWFNNFERTIKHFGIKNQTTKYEALINQLPQEVTDEVKGILRQDEDELGATPYKVLKNELLSLYKCRPEDAYAKASSRVLVGKPSTLGKQIMNDLCECGKSIECKCCAKIIYGCWVKNLPT